MASVYGVTDWLARRVDVIRVEWSRGNGTAANPFRIVTSFYSKDGSLLVCRDPLNGPLRGEVVPADTDEFDGVLGELMCLFEPLSVAVVPVVLLRIKGDGGFWITSCFALDGTLLAEHDSRCGPIDAFFSPPLKGSVNAHPAE